MNVSDLPHPPPDSLTIRVGCDLAYEVDEPTLMLLMIHPRASMQHVVVDNELIISSGEHVERLLDSHGNLVLKTMLVPGLNEIRHDMILCVPDQPDNYALVSDCGGNAALPLDVLRYTLPSRYCESDRLAGFARTQFGGRANTRDAAQAICDWTHRHLEYRYGSGDASLSACEAIKRGYGVCRDFAHVMVALCRALDLPARYVAGHMPLFGAPLPDSDVGIDFHAYVEVYLEGAWHVFDPRHNKSHTGRIKIAHGMDAVDAAFATFYGNVRPVRFQVWAYAVDFATAQIHDPVLLPV
jgi:transglutaminase-like putative cysteine protease